MENEFLKKLDQRAFGFRINAARTDARITIPQLAEMTGVSETFLRHIEIGRRMPSLTVFLNICNALHTAPNYFLSSDLELDVSDPIRMAIDTVSDCSPREGIMMMEMLQAARKHLPSKEII